ncbi:hypothetical protein BCO71171_06723 [Burkholderia contaminans]|uniref:Uncharacterized protein n=1 Tax=Burkholderia contaminans TaxID=488447 RepID=A0A6P3BQS5_9BURK|nr:hypothetical protein BCO71171_06723 [Burkholderia contaminans]
MPLLSEPPISAVGPRFEIVFFALSDTLAPTSAPVLVRLVDCVRSRPPAVRAPTLTMLPALTLMLLTDCRFALFVKVPGNVKARS